MPPWWSILVEIRPFSAMLLIRIRAVNCLTLADAMRCGLLKSAAQCQNAVDSDPVAVGALEFTSGVFRILSLLA